LLGFVRPVVRRKAFVAKLVPVLLALGLWAVMPAVNVPAQETPSDADRPPTQTDQSPADAAAEQEPVEREDRGRYVEKRWTYVLSAYTWLFDTKGDSTFRGIESEVDIPVEDGLDDTDIGLYGYAEANNDEWFIYFDSLYVVTSSSEKDETGIPSDPPLRVRSKVMLDQTMSIFEGGAGHRLFTHVLREDEENDDLRRIIFDAYAGARYYNMYTRHYADFKTFAEPPGGAPVLVDRTTVRGEDTEEWIDPLVGLRTRIDVLKNLAFTARGDVGGFDVGSDLSWKAQLLLDYQVTRRFSVAGGYQWLDIDYDNAKSGSRKYAWDGQYRGPVLGLMFWF